MTYEERIIVKYLREKFAYGPVKIVTDHPEFDWNVNTIKKLLKKIDETGSVDRKEGSGRPRSVRVDENIKQVGEMISSQDSNPGTHSTPSEISLELDISRSSVRRIIDLDLELRPFKKQKVQKLSDNDMERRVQKCQTLLRIFTREVLETAFFSDEKIFKVKQLYNSKNDVVYASKRIKKSEISEDRVIREQAGFPKKLMVSVGISKAGKTSIIFVEEGKTVDAKYYCEKIMKEMMPQMNRLAKGKNYLFMQDGARAHTARLTLDMFRGQKKLRLLEPKQWPANSPDLNPVDYCIWGILEQNVYRGRKITNTSDLKNAIIDEWKKIPQETINKCIDVFPARLKKTVEAEGGHIERY